MIRDFIQNCRYLGRHFGFSKMKMKLWNCEKKLLLFFQILDRLLDFVNDEPEETVDEYVEGEPLAVKT